MSINSYCLFLINKCLTNIRNQLTGKETAEGSILSPNLLLTTQTISVVGDMDYTNIPDLFKSYNFVPILSDEPKVIEFRIH